INEIYEKKLPIVVILKYWYNVNYFIYLKNNQKIKFEGTDYINSPEYPEYYMIISSEDYPIEKIKNATLNSANVYFIKNK
ncbi:hypothetical protein IKE67_04230, partial [bacterium]|nr:hypothetical protein [bacterium]